MPVREYSCIWYVVMSGNGGLRIQADAPDSNAVAVACSRRADAGIGIGCSLCVAKSRGVQLYTGGRDLPPAKMRA